MKRIAVCISGQTRTYKQCLENFKKYIDTINRDREIPIVIDYFYHTWDVNMWVLSAYEKEIRDVRNNPLEKVVVDIDYIASILNVKDYKIESFDEFNKNTDIVTYWNPLFYSMYECNKLKIKYETENGFKYDMVIKSRFDLIFNLEDEYLGKFPIHSIERNTMYACWELEIFENELNTPHFNDIIFFGDSESMDITCNIYKTYINNIFHKINFYGRSENEFPPENLLGPGCLLYRYLSRHTNIKPTYKQQIKYYIARKEVYDKKLNGLNSDHIKEMIALDADFFKLKKVL